MSADLDSVNLLVPGGFNTLQQVQEIFVGEKIHRNLSLNVIGLVKDFQPPKKTNGTDYKCVIEIIDCSILCEPSGIKINIFWPKDHMPTKLSTGDAIVMLKANLDPKWGSLSLLASRATIFYILQSKNVPGKISNLSETSLSWNLFSYGHSPKREKVLSDQDEKILYIKSLIDKKKEFLTSSSPEKSMSNLTQPKSTKEKFSLLKDVKPDRFYDLIVEVVKIWTYHNGLTSIYASDYTSNDLFYHYSSDKCSFETNGREGDEYGYIKNPSCKATWPGPNGKLTIQITLWDFDTEFVSKNLKCGDWLLLTNVRMKMSKQESYLEGSLSQNHGNNGLKILGRTRESSEILSRWQKATTRREEWWENYKHKEAKKKQPSVNIDAGSKRKLDDDDDDDDPNDLPLSKKQALPRKEAISEVKRCKANKKRVRQPVLNNLVTAISLDKTVVSIDDIIAQSFLSIPGVQVIEAPFTNRKYKAIVRVVNYYPHEIEDFAVDSRLDMSDYLFGNSDPEENSLYDKIWEWRFLLQLEDASKTSNKARIWVFVGNQEAKHLLNLEKDAANLRQNPVLRSQLNEQLFRLWGNLQEVKLKQSASSVEVCLNRKFTPSNFSNPHLGDSSPGNQPDADSDVEKMKNTGKVAHQNRQVAELTQESEIMEIINGSKTSEDLTLCIDPPLSNKPFMCCIMQYGIIVPEKDPAKVNACYHGRWQRIYGLFGTQIQK